MRKFCTIVIALLILCLSQINFTSCEKYILPELVLSADTLNITEYEQTVPVSVHSNVKWNVDTESPYYWISYTPKMTVRGDSTIFIKVNANTSEEPREATLTVTSETLRKYLVIRQEGAFL